MEHATLVGKKDGPLCGFSHRSFVSEKWFPLNELAHDNVSGCACSAVRLFYSVNSLHYHDHTYLGGVLTLWGIGETTAGILALCLPLLPKFFQGVQGSQMWFRFRRIRLHPSFNRSKTPLVRAAEIKPIVPPASKAKANGERIIRDDSCTRISDFSS